MTSGEDDGRTEDAGPAIGVVAFAPIGDEATCLHWLWTTLYAPDGVSTVCRHCRVMRRFHRVTRRRAYACDHCGTQVYPTAGTFMQGSGLGIATWFTAAWQLMEGDPNIAPRALADELGVSYKTALRIKRKLEEALGARQRRRRSAGAAAPGRRRARSGRRRRPGARALLSRAREHPRRGLPRVRGARPVRHADRRHRARGRRLQRDHPLLLQVQGRGAARRPAVGQRAHQQRSARVAPGDERPRRAPAPHHRPRHPVRGCAARRVRALDRDVGTGAPASAPARRVRRHVGALGRLLPGAGGGGRGGRGVPSPSPRPTRSPSAWSRSRTA